MEEIIQDKMQIEEQGQKDKDVEEEHQEQQEEHGEQEQHEEQQEHEEPEEQQEQEQNENAVVLQSQAQPLQEVASVPIVNQEKVVQEQVPVVVQNIQNVNTNNNIENVIVVANQNIVSEAAPQPQVIHNQQIQQQQQQQQELEEEQQQQEAEQQPQQKIIEQSKNLELINEFERKIARLKEELTKKTLLLKEFEVNLHHSEKNLEAEKDSNYRLQEKIQELKILNQEGEKFNKQYRQKIENLVQRLKQFEKKDNSKELQIKLNQANIKIQTLQIELENKHLSQQRNAKSNNTTTTFPVMEINDLKLNEQLKKIIKNKETQIAKLMKNLQSSWNEVHSHREKFQKFEFQQKILQTEIESLRTNFKDKITQNHNLLEQLKASKSSLTKKDTQISELQSSLQNQIKKKREIQSNNYLNQKEAILKEFLALEKNYITSQERLEKEYMINSRLQETIRNLNKGMVKKNQYDILLKRYMQAKKCLESALKKVKATGEIDVLEPIFQINNPVQGSYHHLLNEYQFNQYERLKEAVITKKYLLDDPKQELQGIELHNEIKKKNKLLTQYEETITQYRKQLRIKDEAIQVFKQKSTDYSKKLDEIHARCLILQNQNKYFENNHRISKVKLENQEYRILQLVKYIEKLHKETQNWEKAYNILKNKEINNSSMNEEIIQSEIEQQFVQKKIQVRFIDLPKLKIYNSYQTQTQSDTVEFHLRELKLLSNQLKEVPKRMEILVQAINNIKTELEQQKTKYTSLSEKFNAKLLRLNQEKAQNDQWRSRAKQELQKQIRSQFIQIKEFVEGQRLLNALKRAKYLINELQKKQNNDIQEAGEQEEDNKADDPLAL